MHHRLARAVVGVALLASTLIATGSSPAHADHNATHIGPTDLANAGVDSIVASPNYANDHTVFVFADVISNGETSVGPINVFYPECAVYCPTVFKSTDSGHTWTALPTVGIPDFGGNILLPPSYPDDNRIFVGTNTALYVSTDGGSTFDVASPNRAYEAAMSPGFSSGDPWILLSGGHLAYNGTTGATVPRVPLYTGNDVWAMPAYPPDYPATGETMVAADNGGVFGVNVTMQLHVCSTLPTCTVRWTAPTIGDVDMAFSPAYATDGTMFIMVKPLLYKSTDRGNSFTQVAGPIAGQEVIKMTYDPSGRLYAAVVGNDSNDGLFRSTDAGATWTRLLNWPSSSGGIWHVLALSDRIIASTLYGILCSTDDGATWASTC